MEEEVKKVPREMVITDSMDQIVSAIRAKVPLIYVVTHEEARFLDDFDVVISRVFEKKRELWTWSSCSGLVRGWHRFSVVKCDGDNAQTENPRAALERIVKHETLKGVPGDIYVMRDLHKQLTNDIPRMLRDMYEHLITKKKVIIITAPYLGYGPLGEKRGIEPSLEKQITVINYALPDRDLLLRKIRRSVESLKEVKAASKFQLDFTEEQLGEFARACQGLTEQETENAICTSIVRSKTIDVHRLIHEKKNIIKKSDILEYIESSVTTADVGGMDEAKKFFSAYKDAFSDEAKAYGVEPLRGVLLTGVPGTGKSLLAKGIADEFKLPLIRLDVGRVMTGLVGGSEQRMREAIAMAEAIAPCVLWIDEVEKALSGTGSSNFSDGGTLSRVFGTLLTSMQDGMNGITIVATANDISALPPEFIRRFNEVLFVDLPTEDERAEIFSIHLKKKGRNPGMFDLNSLVAASIDYTGAEIEKAVKDSLAIAWSDGRREVSTTDILQALKATKPIAKVMSEKITKLREEARNRFRYASSQAAAKNAPGNQKVTTASGKSLAIKDVLDDIGEIQTKKEKIQEDKEEAAHSAFDLDIE